MKEIVHNLWNMSAQQFELTLLITLFILILPYIIYWLYDLFKR